MKLAKGLIFLFQKCYQPWHAPYTLKVPAMTFFWVGVSNGEVNVSDLHNFSSFQVDMLCFSKGQIINASANIF